jgi:Tol biopolymer transport system component
MGKLFEEIKRRKVFRVAAMYAVVAWVLIQIVDTLFPALQLPSWTITFVTLLLIVGFPIAVILAWAYEVTPEGFNNEAIVQPTTTVSATAAQPINYVILAIVLLVAGFQITDRFLFSAIQSTESITISNTASEQTSRLSVGFPDGVLYQLASGNGKEIALSPDGSELVFRVGDNEGSTLVRRSLDQRILVPIQGTENPRLPFYSPDGASVAFFSGGYLKRVTLDGRSPVNITQSMSGISSGLWVGSEIYYSTRDRLSKLFRVSATANSETEPFEVPLDDSLATASVISELAYVPATQELLLSLTSVGNQAESIVILNQQTWETEQILNNARLVAFMDNDLLVFVQDRNLMAARFDPAGRRVGVAVPVLEDFTWSVSNLRPQIVSSSNGTIAYVAESESPIPAKLNWVDEKGNRTPLGELPPSSALSKLSPDGRLAVIATDSIPNRIFLWDMVLQVPFGVEIENGLYPSWHPDGKHIIFTKLNNAFQEDTIIKRNIEDGSEQALFSSEDYLFTPFVLADGETLLFATGNSENDGIYLRLPGQTEPQLIVENAIAPVVSHNEQWMSYILDGSIFVARFPSGTEPRRVSVDPSIVLTETPCFLMQP